MAKRKRRLRSITVFGRRWFTRTHGNTYFSAMILVDGKHVHRIEYEYGYGDHYIQAAFEWLDANGYTARERFKWGGSTAPWQYCQDNGIALVTECADVTRKRDL